MVVRRPAKPELSRDHGCHRRREPNSRNDDDPAVSQQLEEVDVEMPQTGSSIMMLDPVL
jgi:hypothetical protein